jgi:hypothetical protein
VEVAKYNQTFLPYSASIDACLEKFGGKIVEIPRNQSDRGCDYSAVFVQEIVEYVSDILGQY